MKIDRAIILAAGRSERMNSAMSGMPKCFAEICGKTIIDHLIDNLKEFGCEDIIIIVSRDDAEIFISRNLKARIIEINNPLHTNNMFSLWSARSLISGNTTILYSDIIFSKTFASRAFNFSNQFEIVVGSGVRTNTMQVKTHFDRVVQLSFDLNSNQFFLGMSKIPGELSDRFVSCMQTICECGMAFNQYYTEVFNELIKQKFKVCYKLISSPEWHEVDVPHDLYNARNKFSTWV